MGNTGIYIAEGNSLMREALGSILRHSRWNKIIGDCGRGDIALNEIRSLSPGIVVLDVSLPVIDGWTIARILKNSSPEIQVLMLSMSRDVEYLDFAAVTGVDGYMIKEDAENLPAAIDTITEGKVYISPSLLKYYYKTHGAHESNDQNNTTG